MYKRFIRPILFLLPPEVIHKFIVSILKISFNIPGIKQLIRSIYLVNHPDLKQTFLGLSFSNPVGLAAGFDKNATSFDDLANFGFSFIEIGTITPLPQPGNPKPRSFRLPKDHALINRMGFNNIGVDEAVKNLANHKRTVIIGGNIGKNTATPNSKAAEDYEQCFLKLYDHVNYFVINVSCPNISNLNELQDAKALEQILMRLTDLRKTKPDYKPILLKISPDLTFSEIDETLAVCAKVKIDGIVATNTTTKRENLKSSIDKINKIGKGGLSGRPITQRSTEIIRYIAEKTNHTLPIIGVGGIMTPEDALEKLDAGATLIQVYTGFIYEGTGIVKRINNAIIKQNKNEKK